jgi:hypothetical protein
LRASQTIFGEVWLVESASQTRIDSGWDRQRRAAAVDAHQRRGRDVACLCRSRHSYPAHGWG